jgi:hypothetical protein
MNSNSKAKYLQQQQHHRASLIDANNNSINSNQNNHNHQNSSTKQNSSLLISQNSNKNKKLDTKSIDNFIDSPLYSSLFSKSNSSTSSKLNEGRESKSIVAANIGAAETVPWNKTKTEHQMEFNAASINKKQTNDNLRQQTKNNKALAHVDQYNRFSGASATENSRSGSSGAKQIGNDDPTRQIKFFDDFIDFRGDILKRPPNSKNCRILWEYLYLLLQNPNYSSVIRWEDDKNMVFRIVQAEKLAALWGLLFYFFSAAYTRFI